LDRISAWIFRTYLQADVGTVPDVGHDRFLPDPFQFITRRYTVYLLTATQNIPSKEKGVAYLVHSEGLVAFFRNPYRSVKHSGQRLR
jgi:hypothetical protein